MLFQLRIVVVGVSEERRPLAVIIGDPAITDEMRVF